MSSTPIGTTTDSRSHATGRATRTSGAVLGIIVFLLGIALVASVFVTARALFDAPPPALPTPPANPSPPDAAAPSATTFIGQSLAQFAQKMLVLILMCISGSVIASRGVELFFKSQAAAPPVVIADTPQP